MDNDKRVIRIRRRFSRVVAPGFRRLAVGLAVAVLLCGASTQRVLASQFNHRATVTAQILAGIAPTTSDQAIDSLAATEAWSEHQKWMGEQWSQAKNRIAVMDKWRSQELDISNPHSRTLYYPFSGPDFLNAYTLFPKHQHYILFSLERPGNLPDLESVTPSHFVSVLRDVRSAFQDIFERNYFITDYMTKQLTTPWIRGTVPVMAIMMALLDQRIVRIEPVDLFPELTRTYESAGATRPRKIMRGVRIEFAPVKGGTTRQLYYFSVNATDKALAFYPGFLDWVGQNRPATALIKSASYLLHDNQFAKTREMILSSADVVVQDDTGIPYRYFNRTPWQVRLYGQYHRPIKSLGYGYQPDLESAYKEKADLAPLPFPFGYHWRGQKSGLLVANR